MAAPRLIEGEPPDCPDGSQLLPPPGRLVSVETISHIEELMQESASNIRDNFGVFARRLHQRDIPLPSGYYKFGDERIIFVDIGQGASQTAEDATSKFDRAILAYMRESVPPPSPRRTQMMMLLESGPIEICEATLVPEDDYFKWEFDKETRRPATDQEILEHSCDLAGRIHFRFQYEEKSARTQDDQAALLKIQTAFNLFQDLDAALRQESATLASEVAKAVKAI